MRRVRLAILAVFAALALLLVGGSMTGFAVSSAHAEPEGEAVHVAMLLLLVAGLLASFEFYRTDEKEPHKKLSVV